MQPCVQMRKETEKSYVFCFGGDTVTYVVGTLCTLLTIVFWLNFWSWGQYLNNQPGLKSLSHSSAFLMQPLSTKLVLQKKKAKEGKSKYEIERDFEAPSEVTIQRRDFSQEEEDERDVLRQKFMEVGQFTSEYQTLIYPPPLRTLEFFLAWFDLQLLCYLLSMKCSLWICMISWLVLGMYNTCLQYRTILHWVDCNCRAWIFFSCWQFVVQWFQGGVKRRHSPDVHPSSSKRQARVEQYSDEDNEVSD